MHQRHLPYRQDQTSKPWVCLIGPPNSARSSARLLDHRHGLDIIASALRSELSAIRRVPGQAVAGGLLFCRRARRVRGAPAAPVVAPGLLPRFFSVLPTPANFSSR
jgi:hypothetical protein